jgi:hypothetical protein
MFQIDDKFLEQLGLGELPQAEKDKMKAHIYETLEMQVGMRLASGMTDEQLDEFEGFMSGDVSHATNYLAKLNPNWQQDEQYQAQIKQATAGGVNPDSVTSEYAALRWLETNFPNYKQVVADELEKLKNEIKQAAPHIIAESKGTPPPQA